MASASEEPNKTRTFHHVDELDRALQNCLSLLTSQEYFNAHDSDEIKTGVEHAVHQLVDVAKETEAYFLRKRLVLSKQKPELQLKDEMNDLRIELQRKEALLEKHQERLSNWQNLLSSSGGTSQPQQQVPPPQIQPPPQHHHTMPNPAQMGMGHHYQMQTLPPPQAMPKVHTPPMAGHIPQNQGMVMGQGHPPQQPPPSYAQAPSALAYLEQTMSNIGMPERR
ncbi:hypothetical protein ScPMuIL_001915 [Solemya velum]